MGNAVEKFRGRIEESLTGAAPKIVAGYIKSWAPSIGDFAIELFLQTLEEEGPQLVAQIDAAPQQFPGLTQLLAKAREIRAQS